MRGFCLAMLALSVIVCFNMAFWITMAILVPGSSFISLSLAALGFGITSGFLWMSGVFSLLRMLVLFASPNKPNVTPLYALIILCLVLFVNVLRVLLPFVSLFWIVVVSGIASIALVCVLYGVVKTWLDRRKVK